MRSRRMNQRNSSVGVRGVFCVAALIAAGAVTILAAGAGPASGLLPAREDCNSNGVEDDQDIAAWGTAFDVASSWAAFDPGAHGVGVDPDGYWGGAFDGRYVYFAPWDNGAGPHGEVMRLDTTADFQTAGAWATFDPGSHGVGTDPDGYIEAIFDGRYVYFVPDDNGTAAHGEVLRFDTRGDFFDTSSWATFHAGAHDVGTDPDGYNGGAFDGRYVYFAPYDNGTVHHSEVLRYDTTGEFEDVASWVTFNPYQHGVNQDYGYCGAVFDGRYVYFVPNCRSDTYHHGEVLLYDTAGAFQDAAAWKAFDPGDHGVGTKPDGYVGGVYDGQYIYFVPCYKEPSGWHGEVMRYNTAFAFDDVAAWDTFDPGAHGVGTDPDGFVNGFFDGRFVYFVPAMNGAAYSGEAMRYDTTGGFSDVGSWITFDPGAHGVGNIAEGFSSGAFDGRYVYFSPTRWSVPHGEFMRYDIAAVGSPDCNGNGVPDECDLDDQTSDDCNDNGVPDECDVACGRSWDVNDNGIPDECEESCPADINNDLTVNIDDLFAILGAWGPCDACPEDISDDGVVNIDDLFEVLAQWGPCS